MRPVLLETLSKADLMIFAALSLRMTGRWVLLFKWKVRLISIRSSVFRSSKAIGGPFYCLSKMRESQIRVENILSIFNVSELANKTWLLIFWKCLFQVFFYRFSGIWYVNLKYLKYRVPYSLNLQRIIFFIMAVKPPKRKRERLSRRKSTLINKAYELVEFYDIDIALIIRNRQTGRYFTYNSVDLESFPPSKEQIASHYP